MGRFPYRYGVSFVMKKRPKVGVAIIVRRNGNVLIGKRKVRIGKGEWAFPGGHLELNESLEDCVKREVYEEAGIAVDNISFLTFTNDIRKKERTHYITLFFTTNYKSGQVRNMEPHKCEGWKWVTWNKLPSPLFLPIRNLLAQNVSPFT